MHLQQYGGPINHMNMNYERESAGEGPAGPVHMAHMIRRAGALAVDLVYPRRCPVCDRPVKPFGALICEECGQMLEPVQAPVCKKCGKPLRTAGQVLCGGCRSMPHIYERGCAVFTYQSASGGIFRFKYEGRQEYAAFYGMCMARKLREFCERCQWPDMLVPVPIAAHKLHKRGYNQALLLAREISRRTKIPVRDDLLRRVSDTLPMKNMSPAERQNNLKKAFQCYGNDVELNSIMLIDDIYTTGSTIDACAQALYRKGAGHVYFMTLAIGEDYGC